MEGETSGRGGTAQRAAFDLPVKHRPPVDECGWLLTAPRVPNPLAAGSRARVMQEFRYRPRCQGSPQGLVERIERLEEKKALTDDPRHRAEPPGSTQRRCADRGLRKQDVEERKEQEAILETYLQALGMLGS
jgi:hypothetical protein